MQLYDSKYDKSLEAYNDDQIEQAIKLMKNSAEQGDAKAYFMLAIWYEELDDQENYIFWMEELGRLAALNNAEAQWQLSECYRYANYLPHDLKESDFWLKKAANNGNGEAQNLLGYLYGYGIWGYEKDVELSEYWYQKAFEQRDPETLYLFATRLLRNNSDDSKKEAIKLLQEAENHGMGQARDVLDELINKSN